MFWLFNKFLLSLVTKSITNFALKLFFKYAKLSWHFASSFLKKEAD